MRLCTCVAHSYLKASNILNFSSTTLKDRQVLHLHFYPPPNPFIDEELEIRTNLKCLRGTFYIKKKKSSNRWGVDQGGGESRSLSVSTFSLTNSLRLWVKTDITLELTQMELGQNLGQKENPSHEACPWKNGN